MHDVAWRGMWICVRSKDAQKQLARTSLNGIFAIFSVDKQDWNLFLWQDSGIPVSHSFLLIGIQCNRIPETVLGKLQ